MDQPQADWHALRWFLMPGDGVHLYYLSLPPSLLSSCQALPARRAGCGLVKRWLVIDGRPSSSIPFFSSIWFPLKRKVRDGQYWPDPKDMKCYRYFSESVNICMTSGLSMMKDIFILKFDSSETCCEVQIVDGQGDVDGTYMLSTRFSSPSKLWPTTSL